LLQLAQEIGEQRDLAGREYIPHWADYGRFLLAYRAYVPYTTCESQ